MHLMVGAALSPICGLQAAEVMLTPTQESAAALAVIYPDIPEPYRSVFMQIVDGVTEASTQKVHVIPVGSKIDVSSLNAQLKRLNVKAVIALGRQGLKTAEQLDRDIAVTVGGVLSLPDAQQQSYYGISLTPDPALPGIRIEATVKTSGQTGVEMEALAAVSVAALTVYDMVKAVEKSMVIDGLRLILKDGGKSGRYEAK